MQFPWTSRGLSMRLGFFKISYSISDRFLNAFFFDQSTRKLLLKIEVELQSLAYSPLPYSAISHVMRCQRCHLIVAPR